MLCKAQGRGRRCLQSSSAYTRFRLCNAILRVTVTVVRETAPSVIAVARSVLSFQVSQSTPLECTDGSSHQGRSWRRKIKLNIRHHQKTDILGAVLKHRLGQQLNRSYQFKRVKTRSLNALGWLYCSLRPSQVKRHTLYSLECCEAQQSKSVRSCPIDSETRTGRVTHNVYSSTEQPQIRWQDIIHNYDRKEVSPSVLADSFSFPRIIRIVVGPVKILSNFPNK